MAALQGLMMTQQLGLHDPLEDPDPWAEAHCSMLRKPVTTFLSRCPYIPNKLTF